MLNTFDELIHKYLYKDYFKMYVGIISNNYHMIKNV